MNLTKQVIAALVVFHSLVSPSKATHRNGSFQIRRSVQDSEGIKSKSEFGGLLGWLIDVLTIKEDADSRPPSPVYDLITTPSPATSIPSASPTVTPSFVHSDRPSLIPKRDKGVSPPTKKEKISRTSLPTLAPSNTTTTALIAMLNSNLSTSPHSTPSDLPSLSPSTVSVAITKSPDLAPSFTPYRSTSSDAPSSYPSNLAINYVPSVLSSDFPSMVALGDSLQIDNNQTDYPKTTFSDVPSTAPSDLPSIVPSDVPSALPSLSPISLPSMTPSDVPSTSPSDFPIVGPNDFPNIPLSDVPSMTPSDVPSMAPSDVPSMIPSDIPSMIPSYVPSMIPSDVPSVVPSDVPSVIQSVVPTIEAPDILSLVPSNIPSLVTSSVPSEAVILSDADRVISDGEKILKVEDEDASSIQLVWTIVGASAFAGALLAFFVAFLLLKHRRGDSITDLPTLVPGLGENDDFEVRYHSSGKGPNGIQKSSKHGSHNGSPPPVPETIDPDDFVSEVSQVSPTSSCRDDEHRGTFLCCVEANSHDAYMDAMEDPSFGKTDEALSDLREMEKVHSYESSQQSSLKGLQLIGSESEPVSYDRPSTLIPQGTNTYFRGVLGSVRSRSKKSRLQDQAQYFSNDKPAKSNEVSFDLSQTKPRDSTDLQRTNTKEMTPKRSNRSTSPRGYFWGSSPVFSHSST